MKIVYTRDNIYYATRIGNYVPRVGDRVRLKRQVFDVVSVTWDEDDDLTHVTVELTPIP